MLNWRGGLRNLCERTGRADMMDSPQRIKDAMKAFYAKNVRYHELIDRHEQTGATYDGMVKELLDRAAPPGRRPRLVDVALGTGYYVRQAKASGAFACGVDISLHACRLARGKDEVLPVCLGDAESLPFRDEVFDVAVCLQLLEHTPFPEKVVGEIARVLRKGGYLFLSAPNMLGSTLFSRTLRAVKERFSRATKRLIFLPADTLAGWEGEVTPQEVADLDTCNRVTVFHARNLLHGHGFRIEHLDTLRHPKKYRPARYMLERALQHLPVLRYTGVNFKIIARKP